MKLTESNDFEQEIVDLGYKIDLMKGSRSKMYHIVYNREKLIKMFGLYFKHLEVLNKAINFQRGSSHAGS